MREMSISSKIFWLLVVPLIFLFDIFYFVACNWDDIPKWIHNLTP